MRSLFLQAFIGLWPYRKYAGFSIVLQMAAVAAESLAILTLGKLFIVSLEDGSETSSWGFSFSDKVISATGHEPGITSLFVIVFILLGIKAVFQTSATFAGNVLHTKYQKTTQDDLTEAYGQADWNYLGKQRSGTMLNLMLSEITRAGTTLHTLLQIASGALSAIVYLIFALLVSPVAVGLFIAAFAVMLLVLFPVFRSIRNLGESLIESRTDLTHKIEELSSGVKVIKALGSEERVQHQIKENTSQMRRLLLRAGFMKEMSSTTDLGILVSVLVLFLLHLSATEQAISAGVIGVILLRMSQRAQVVLATSGPAAEGWPSLKTVSKSLKDMRNNRERIGGKLPGSSSSSLRFEKVSYEYDANSTVLNQIDLEIKNGEFIGIVGESGTGKTTLVDLILGLLNPTTGRIFVGDVDLSELQRPAWRRTVGYVPQDVTLFHDTIYNNISAYRSSVSKEDVYWATNIAQASVFIEESEEGYDRVVGDRGIRVSGGQRQRLALARALATRPDILLLDEATSSLDGNAENEFQLALENIRSQMTIIAVAHRIPTVMRADRVLVVSRGEIVESGPPLELLKIPNGRFAKLRAVQSSSPSNTNSDTAGTTPSGENISS
jgi:ABC-type multidrug transport system fused ATPase/permease subunit